MGEEEDEEAEEAMPAEADLRTQTKRTSQSGAACVDRDAATEPEVEAEAAAATADCADEVPPRISLIATLRRQLIDAAMQQQQVRHGKACSQGQRRCRRICSCRQHAAMRPSSHL